MEIKRNYDCLFCSASRAVDSATAEAWPSVITWQWLSNWAMTFARLFVMRERKRQADARARRWQWWRQKLCQNHRTEEIFFCFLVISSSSTARQQLFRLQTIHFFSALLLCSLSFDSCCLVFTSLIYFTFLLLSFRCRCSIAVIVLKWITIFFSLSELRVGFFLLKKPQQKEAKAHTIPWLTASRVTHSETMANQQIN